MYLFFVFYCINYVFVVPLCYSLIILISSLSLLSRQRLIFNFHLKLFLLRLHTVILFRAHVSQKRLNVCVCMSVCVLSSTPITSMYPIHAEKLKSICYHTTNSHSEPMLALAATITQMYACQSIYH